MTTTDSTTPTASELADFPELTRRYERELLAHCYRMSGSVHEAEDLVQETLLRAWKSSEGFRGESSVRTWLHRIATNVCLTSIENRARRPLPSGLGTPDTDNVNDLPQDAEVTWLEPVPDAAVQVEERESIRLAFVAALQHLPARQRAALLLCDVLRWPAKDAAETLGTSVASINSALQRARAMLADLGLDRDQAPASTSVVEPELLEKYVDAFWRKDVATIVSLLHQDSVWEMPPFTSWFRGAETIGRLIQRCPGGPEDMPMLFTEANGQPAYGLYMRNPDGDFEPFQLQVLEIEDGKVRHVVAFFDTSLFETFGLPPVIPARSAPA